MDSEMGHLLKGVGHIVYKKEEMKWQLESGGSIWYLFINILYYERERE
jgi:hypothetical protein